MLASQLAFRTLVAPRLLAGLADAGLQVQGAPAMCASLGQDRAIPAARIPSGRAPAVAALADGSAEALRAGPRASLSLSPVPGFRR